MNTNQKIKVIFLLADVIDQYSNEIKQEVNHEFKRDINMLIKCSKKLIKFADLKLDSKDAELFGDDADLLRSEIDNIAQNKYNN